MLAHYVLPSFDISYVGGWIIFAHTKVGHGFWGEMILFSWLM
jgi:hypothetical protein